GKVRAGPARPMRANVVSRGRVRTRKRKSCVRCMRRGSLTVGWRTRFCVDYTRAAPLSQAPPVAHARPQRMSDLSYTPRPRFGGEGSKTNRTTFPGACLRTGRRHGLPGRIFASPRHGWERVDITERCGPFGVIVTSKLRIMRWLLANSISLRRII